MYPVCETATTWVAVGQRAGRGQQRVHRDPVEGHAQLRPGGDAVDVAGVARAGQRVDLVPGPGRLPLDQPLDGERPAVGADPRGGLGVQHRPVVAGVVLPRGQPRVAGGAPPAEETSGRRGHPRVPSARESSCCPDAAAPAFIPPASRRPATRAAGPRTPPGPSPACGGRCPGRTRRPGRSPGTSASGRTGAATPARRCRGLMCSASKSASRANTVTCLPPRWRTEPSGTSGPSGGAEPSSSVNSRTAARAGSSSAPCSPFGIDQAPSSLRAQNGPPMCPSSSSGPSGPVRYSSRPALVIIPRPRVSFDQTARTGPASAAGTGPAAAAAR